MTKVASCCEAILNILRSQVVGVIIGGLITLGVAQCYYKKASVDLRWEARAGAIPHGTLELLVAYVDWGEDLRTDQAISIGDSNNYPNLRLPFNYVKKQLEGVGLATSVDVTVMTPTGSDEPISESYPTLFITDEGKKLAKYVKKARGIDRRVVELFRMRPGEQIQAPIECLWTIVPGKKSGPWEEYAKPFE